MRIIALVTVELDADDYRARLRDDVPAPSDDDMVELAMTLLGQARLGALDVAVTVRASTLDRK